MYKVTIEVEKDDFEGFHAIVIDAEDDSVLFITDTYSKPEDAEREARQWVNSNDNLTLRKAQ